MGKKRKKKKEEEDNRDKEACMPNKNKDIENKIYNINIQKKRQ